MGIINNPEYFSREKAGELISKLQSGSQNIGQYEETSPRIGVTKLIEKQKGYLKIGESWQFAKIGLEVSRSAQRIAYKLHALQELLEPFAAPGATQYEDQLADIFTSEIMGQSDRYKILAGAIGPYRFAIRWQDFLEGAENPPQHLWIQDALKNNFPKDRQKYPDILLTIALAESQATPGTTIQLLEKKTFRSTGAVPPLRPEDVEDSHIHKREVKLYLPLMGPGKLKVQFEGKGPVHTLLPDPNVVARLDLTQLGAKMVDGVPTLVYEGREYQPEGHFINLPLADGGVAQFIVVRPGDIHDFQNEGISPASAYALTLGFPANEGDVLEGDFTPQHFSESRS